MNMVIKSLRILACEGGTEWRDMLSHAYGYAVLGIIAFIVYGIRSSIIAFSSAASKVCGKNLQHKNRTSLCFTSCVRLDDRFVQGPRLFLGVLQCCSEGFRCQHHRACLQQSEARARSHALFSVSLALHAFVRPYKYRSGNVLMVLFCACQIIGASGQDGPLGLPLQIAPCTGVRHIFACHHNHAANRACL